MVLTLKMTVMHTSTRSVQWNPRLAPAEPHLTLNHTGGLDSQPCSVGRATAAQAQVISSNRQKPSCLTGLDLNNNKLYSGSCHPDCSHGQQYLPHASHSICSWFPSVTVEIQSITSPFPAASAYIRALSPSSSPLPLPSLHHSSRSITPGILPIITNSVTKYLLTINTYLIYQSSIRNDASRRGLSHGLPSHSGKPRPAPFPKPPASSHPQALALDSPIPGYSIVPLTWEVEAFDNGTTVNLTGTIEQVIDDLTKINPNFPGSNITNTTDFAISEAPSDFRTACGPGPWGWEGGNRERVWEGYVYLNKVSGKPGQGPGPGSCGRVSCSYNAAIWWCNDNNREFHLNGFDVIAQCAKTLYDQCHYVKDNVGPELVRGQSFVSFTSFLSFGLL